MAIDATLIATVALVLFLALVFYLKVPGKVLGGLDKRASKIRDDLDEARRLREEAQGLLADYQRRAREAEKEAKAVIEEAKTEGERIKLEAQQRISELIERRTKTVEDKIKQAETQALIDVQVRVAEIATLAAQNVLMEQVPGEVDDKLIDEAIREATRHLTH